MRLSDKISGSLSSKFDKSILLALNEACEEKVKECDKKQELKEETLSGEKIVWDNYEDYSEEEIEQINNILNNLNLTAIKYEGDKEQGYSVAIKDNNSGLVFWIDYQKDGPDIYGEFNQYIFRTDNSNDRIRQAIQTSMYEDGTTIAFEAMESEGLQYLEDKGLVTYTDNNDMIFESCKTELNEDIKDDTAQAAKYIALEIQERGIMNFEEIDEMAADQLGITVEELRDQQLDTDIYISLNYEGIDNNMSTGDFYTQEYAEEHPEVLEESEKEECKECDNKENLKEEQLNETDATPEFLEDLKNLINSHMRVDKIASMELQEDNETGNEIVIITFENGGIIRENVTGDSNLALARAILFRLA